MYDCVGVKDGESETEGVGLGESDAVDVSDTVGVAEGDCEGPGELDGLSGEVVGVTDGVRERVRVGDGVSPCDDEAEAEGVRLVEAVRVGVCVTGDGVCEGVGVDVAVIVAVVV